MRLALAERVANSRGGKGQRGNAMREVLRQHVTQQPMRIGVVAARGICEARIQPVEGSRHCVSPQAGMRPKPKARPNFFTRADMRWRAASASRSFWSPQ